MPGHGIPNNELLDIFYAGLTDESRSYLDSCASCVFRERTPDDAEELMCKIAKNHEDWSVPKPLLPPKKRGMLVLNPEDMQEAKKTIKEKGIKAEDVKNLPPIEKLCESTTHPPLVEVHSLLEFTKSDIPKGKPPDQCLDELDNFIVKQDHFNRKLQSQLHDNSLAIKSLCDVLERTVNDVKCLVKHFHMVQTQLEQISNVQKICLLIMPNRTYKPTELKLGVEHTPRTHSILRDIQRGSSKILKCKKKTRLLVLQRRKRRNTRRLTIPMILLHVKSQLLILTAYLPPMLKQKTMSSLRKNTLRRMIHLR